MVSYSKFLSPLITSAVVAVGCASVVFLIFKYSSKYKNAADALTYLTIEIVTTEESCNAVITELRKRIRLHRAVGFDCEWITIRGRRQPVSLLQLSSFDGYCVLIRLNHLKNIPELLKELLADENIYKVGVAAFDDAKYLFEDYSVVLKSTLDLRHIVEECGHTPGGLAYLAKSELQIILDKNWKVRCSDWEADKLTEAQQNYAAADAHIVIKIFVNLINEKDGSLWRWLKCTNHNTIWNNLNDICWKYADISFKTKHPDKARNNLIKKKKELKQAMELSTIVLKKHGIRTKPLYHNCFLEAPDGELLCTCDTKKADWYVKKELADIVKEDPLTVRLRFEPSGRSMGDVGRYYQLVKENKCVVCGMSNSYIRKNVVPREYRKFFPEVMKDHSSHDVLLLCVGCHRRSIMQDQLVRRELAAKCNAPLNSHGNMYNENPDNRKIRSAARALLYQSKKHVLPESKVKELENVILQHLPEHKHITEELLQEASNIQFAFKNIDYESHGQKVVDYYLKHDGLLQLEELWREHFLVSMQPRYMPELWSVKHNEERLRIRMDEGRLSEEDADLLRILIT